MTQRQASVSAVLALGLIALGSAWNDARAQAWVGDKGALDLSLDYNLGVSSKVIVDKGADVPDAGTTTQQFTLGAEYVPIEKLAVSASLPLAMLKFTGDQGLNKLLHTVGGRYDDGKYHTTLTDLRAGARYQILDEPFALGVHLAFSVPVADYETSGGAVAGRHLKQLHMGAGIGKLIGVASYVHLLYEFSLVERDDRTPDTKVMGQNHTDVAFTAGHRVLDQRLDLHVGVNSRWTHGGVDFSNFTNLTPNQQMYHDTILDEQMVLVGAGVSYQVSNQLAFNLDGRLFVNGRNTQNASVLAVGIVYSPL